MKQVGVFFLRLLLICLIVMFYFWTTSYGSFKFYPANGKYNLLAEGFLRGQLNLPIEVPQGLLDLKDSYDPTLNKEYRAKGIHDLSLYNKKLYLFFGATPVITLYIPYKLLTNKIMSNNLAVFFFTCGTLLWSIFLLLYLKKKYFHSIPEWMFLIAISVIGFTNASGVLLRRPAIYEVAISAGCFFLMGAVYFLCLAVDNLSSWKMFIAGAFAGLGVGARPQILLTGFSLIILTIFLHRKNNFLKLLKSFLAFITPFSVFVGLVLLYNYFRFGSISEFGVRYQLAGINNHLYSLFDLKNILGKVYLTLYCAPDLSSVFPFVYPKFWLPPFPPFPPGLTTPERVCGLIPSVPFVLVLFIYPIIYRLMNLLKLKVKQREENSFPKKEFFIILLSGLINLFVLLMYIGSVLRYNADFFNYFILTACVVWFYFDNLMKDYPLVNNVFRIIVLSLVFISIVNGVSFSIIGSYDDFRKFDLEQFHKTELLFKPISDLLYSILKS